MAPAESAFLVDESGVLANGIQIELPSHLPADTLAVRTCL